MPSEQAGLDTFIATTDADADAAEDADEWPSTWRCGSCDLEATYTLHARVTPSCPRCLEHMAGVA